MSPGAAMKAVRPIISKSHHEARLRALNLYRAWYRQLPYVVKHYAPTFTPVSVHELHDKLRDEFNKNKNVKDLRLIDLLIHRGQNELIEIAHLWKSDTHVMDYFREEKKQGRGDFIDKFLAGHQD